VRVREHETAEILGAAFDELEIRHDDVDAGIELAFRERNAEVDHEPLATALRPQTVEIAVHADLAEPTECQKDQLAFALCICPRACHGAPQACAVGSTETSPNVKRRRPAD